VITLSGGAASLETMLEAYQAAWRAFIVVNHLESFERLLTPIAMSWKVEHKIALYANLRLLGDKASQVHIGTVNDRFIAMALLRKPYTGVRIIKIMERRATAHDPLGLDSIDYYVIDLEKVYEILKTAGARVEKERNDVHEWLSLRFGKNHEYEAKFIDHSLVDVAIAELEAAKHSA
jgi:hypothetical protein